MTTRTKSPFPWLLALTWLVLLGAAVGGFLTGEFSVTFVGAGTFLLTLIPFWLAPRIGRAQARRALLRTGGQQRAQGCRLRRQSVGRVCSAHHPSWT